MNAESIHPAMTQEQFKDCILSLAGQGRYAEAVGLIRDAERANITFMGLDVGSFLFGWFCGDAVGECCGGRKGCCSTGCCCLGSCLCIAALSAG